MTYFPSLHFVLTRFIACISISVALMSCSGNNREITLQYNLEEGNTFRQKTVTEQVVKQEFQGESQTVVNKVQTISTYEILKNDGNSTDIRVGYDTMDVFITLPDRNMHFSSRGSFWKQEDLFSQVLNSMSGKSFVIKIENKSGKIISIDGLSDTFQKILGEFQTANAEQFSSVMEMLNKSYGENAFKDAFESSNAYLSGKQLSEGSTWEVTTNLSNVNATMMNQWELKELKRNEAVISGNGTLKMIEGAKEVEVEGVTTKLQLEGQQVSKLTINTDSNWPIASTVKQNLRGVMNLKDRASGQTASLPIEMTNTISYQILD